MTTDEHRQDLEALVAACEAVFCSPATETKVGDMGPCADADAVMGGTDGDDPRLTFGMIRRARRALNNL